MVAPFAGKNREVNAQGTRAHGRRPVRFHAVPDKFVTSATEPARSFPVPAKTLLLQAKEGGSITMKHWGQHAIVIGASMGGLLAARALSDFYAVVTVLERDTFPLSDVPRKGVPQGRHPHGLLARGRRVIERFFPGWTDEVVASGGVRGDIAGDVNWIGHGVTIKSTPSDLIGLLASRPVLEGHVRRRLMALPNVRVIENSVAQGLIAADGKAAIAGVRVKAGDGAEHAIMADLVIDASGRGSSSPAW